MEAPAPAGARAGLACGPALLGQLSAPRAQATPPLADAAAALYTVLGSGDEAGFQDASVALAARRAEAGSAAAPLRVHLRAPNGRYLCITGGVPRAHAHEPCSCEDVVLTTAIWGHAAAVTTTVLLTGCGSRVLSVQPDGLIIAVARDIGDTRHENFRVRLHRGGARPAISLEAVGPDGASRPVRLGRDGALRAVSRGSPSRFALEPASGSRVLLQLASSGELLCPVVAPPSARRVPVAFLPAPGAAAAWTLTHHGDGRYTLAAAADGEPRRHLTREASGAVVLSSDPALAFPAPASLFTLEATSDGAGGVAAWLLRPCGAAGVVARGDAGRAAALQRSPVPADSIRIIDVAAAAAAAAGGGAAAHAAARAAMSPDAPRAACWAAAGAAAAAADTGTAAGARRPPATLRALVAAALSREAPMEAGGVPPAALTEAEQQSAFGAVFVPDFAAAAVKAAWLARQPAPGGACKVPLPADTAPFPGAMRCACCDKTVLRMAAESNPAHHGYLAAEARRAARAAPPRNGSVPGAFWHAVGSAVCVALVAAAAGSGVRCAVHARAHRRAARAA